MGIAMFYHLTRSSPEDTLATILPRAMAAGWRVMLRGTDQAALNRLDEQLWLGAEESFLPHGLQDEPHAADQPILLGTGAIGNAAQGLILIGSADTDPAEAMALERVWVLFDGADDKALAHARAMWTRLTTAGMAAQYWSEDGGRWEMKADKPAATHELPTIWLKLAIHLSLNIPGVMSGQNPPVEDSRKERPARGRGWRPAASPANYRRRIMRSPAISIANRPR